MPIIPQLLRRAAAIIAGLMQKAPTFLRLPILLPGGSEVKRSASNVGDLGSIPGLGDPLEKEMATHSSTIAWKMPWMEEPGRLQSMGS